MSNLEIVSETQIEVRWVAFLSGDTPTADYAATASEGVGGALVQEVSDLCARMHPHNDAGQFPRDRDVYLFFKSKESQDYVVTRVSADTGSSRLALRYYSLIFDYADFSALRFNPFQTRTLRLHDRAAQQAHSGTEPLRTSVRADVTPSGRAAGKSVSAQFPPGTNLLPTQANVARLEEYCAQLSAIPEIPPTFATWWAGGQSIPKDYFDVVLQATPMKIMTLSVALETARGLEAEVKAALPNAHSTDTRAMSLTDAIAKSARAVSTAIQNTGGSGGSETEFRRCIADAVEAGGQAGTDLYALVQRMNASLSSTEAARLTDLAQRYEKFADGLPGIAPPRSAFQQGGLGTSSTTGQNVFGGDSAVTPARKSKAGPIAAGLAALVLAGGGWWKYKHPSPAPASSANGKPSAADSAPMPDMGHALLDTLHGLENKTGDAIKTKAKAKAREEVSSRKGLDEDDVRKIAMGQIKAVYKENLKPEDYQHTFNAGYTWKQYAKIFDQDWLASIYSVTKSSAEQKADEYPAPVVHHTVVHHNSADDEPAHRHVPARRVTTSASAGESPAHAKQTAKPTGSKPKASGDSNGGLRD